ncbi:MULTISPECIES: hypothetical protein [Halomonadaceae]|uniref:phage adaptor protein n=1 Tax=Halomonadaceae TaxID=28256 RepID=UPI001599A51E|nr:MULTISPECIES: hypothetical protein [Halomonas]QJQ93915.1 hypothetical protein HIO72_00465 [Halomonas sp. PA5]
MTFLELCQRLRQEVGAAGTGPAAVTGQHGEYARLIGWIQQAWMEIQTRRTDWRFSWAEGEVELESGYRDYALPDDFARFIPGTIYLDDRQLTLLPYSEFRRRFRKAAPERPRHITVTPGDVMRLGGALTFDGMPSEDETLSFEYFRKPQVLSANGDTPRLPEEHHMAIVYRAMTQYGLYENAPEVIQQGASNEARLMNEIERSQLPAVVLPGGLA